MDRYPVTGRNPHAAQNLARGVRKGFPHFEHGGPYKDTT